MPKAILIALLASCLLCLAAEPQTVAPVVADSVPVAKPSPDTMFVIPAGPQAGSFTHDSRITVVDTVAGWAKIFVEGWVPVAAVQDRLASGATVSAESSPFQQKPAEKVVAPPRQCEAMTQKGTRCKRKAMKGSKYCWQHQIR